VGLPVGDVGEGETVSVGDGVGVGDGDSVGVVVAEGVGDSVITGALGITEGKGCGGGGSDPRSAQRAVTASPTIVASASQVHTGLSFAGGWSSGAGAPTGSNGSVGCWSAMRPG